MYIDLYLSLKASALVGHSDQEVHSGISTCTRRSLASSTYSQSSPHPTMEWPSYPPIVNQQWNHALSEKTSSGSSAELGSVTLSTAVYASPPAFACQTLSSSSTSSPDLSPLSQSAHSPSFPQVEAVACVVDDDVSHDWNYHIPYSPDIPLYLFQQQEGLGVGSWEVVGVELKN